MSKDLIIMAEPKQMQPKDLVAIRRRLGFTQTQLAQELGYAGKSRISQMETGHTRVPPRLAMLLRRMDKDDTLGQRA